MRVLITGGNGYIARSLYSALADKHRTTKVTRADFDLSDSGQTANWFNKNEYDVVIHTAVVGGHRLRADDLSVLEKNLLMHYNLHSCRKAFSRLISFGSGAELFAPNTPYGMSKRVIANSINETDNWHNIRVFAVFDHNELDTRFIKTNTFRYINKQAMVIHKNKVMDFFYMEDLATLVNHYLQEEAPPKVVHCSYDRKHTLTDIAKIINSLGSHSVPIRIEESGSLEFYCGDCDLPNIPLLGLEEGIRRTFARISA